MLQRLATGVIVCVLPGKRPVANTYTMVDVRVRRQQVVLALC